jgi:hypothetical protein
MNLLNSLPIQILCLDKRQELWSQLIPELTQLSDNINPFIVGDGEILSKSQYNKINWPREKMGPWGYGSNDTTKWKHWNASISHRMMIQRAKDNRWPSFLMLEDDVYITKRFEKVLPKIVVPQNNFDLLYLGWWMGNEDDEFNTSIEKNYNMYDRVQLGCAKLIGGLHAVIISESMYDVILDLPWTNPIDALLNIYDVHSKINSYYLMPKIIHVKSVYSNCEECTFIRKEL